MKTMMMMVILTATAMTGFAKPNIKHLKSKLPDNALLKNWAFMESKVWQTANITKLSGDSKGPKQTNIMITDDEMLTMHLFLSRDGVASAALENYSLILHSADGATPLYQMDMEAQPSTQHQADVYFNYTAVELPDVPHEFMLTVWERSNNSTTTYYVQLNTDTVDDRKNGDNL